VTKNMTFNKDRHSEQYIINLDPYFKSVWLCSWTQFTCS